MKLTKSDMVPGIYRLKIKRGSTDKQLVLVRFDKMWSDGTIEFSAIASDGLDGWITSTFRWYGMCRDHRFEENDLVAIPFEDLPTYMHWIDKTPLFDELLKEGLQP